MALFRRKAAEVVRKGVGESPVEERKTKKIGRNTVEVRRIREAPKPDSKKPDSKQRQRSGRNQTRRSQPDRSRNKGSNGPRPRRQQEEVILPPETGKKQMLVRSLPHQTQVVILEGPTLVEHYVAKEESHSLAQNVYIGVAKNILPGMEAAFLDFGVSKNGVLYAGDVRRDGKKGANQRIENVLKTGDRVLVQVVKDAMGHKGARLTGQISLPGRYLVLQPESDAAGDQPASP